MDYKEKVEWLGRYQASVSCQHMLEEKSSAAQRRRAGDGLQAACPAQRPNADRLPRAVERIEEAQKRLEQLEAAWKRARKLCAAS
ncbi:hypothetical protein [Gemmiger formicilis]|uniref:hypothetical protein n=1 Tax=Gemmiger formicilis TaxID=745368 RepID=UPI003CCA7A93